MAPWYDLHTIGVSAYNCGMERTLHVLIAGARSQRPGARPGAAEARPHRRGLRARRGPEPQDGLHAPHERVRRRGPAHVPARRPLRALPGDVAQDARAPRVDRPRRPARRAELASRISARPTRARGRTRACTAGRCGRSCSPASGTRCASAGRPRATRRPRAAFACTSRTAARRTATCWSAQTASAPRSGPSACPTSAWSRPASRASASTGARCCRARCSRTCRRCCCRAC